MCCNKTNSLEAYVIAVEIYWVSGDGTCTHDSLFLLQSGVKVRKAATIPNTKRPLHPVEREANYACPSVQAEAEHKDAYLPSSNAFCVRKSSH